MKTKRQIASRVLLAVLLPMLLISSLHIHPLPASAPDAECADCIQHHCEGHIGQQVQVTHDCVLCQFLTLPKVVAAVEDVIPTDCIYKFSYAQCPATLMEQTMGNIVTHGPPVL